MRDLVFVALVGSLIPLCFFRPFVGVILWSWLSFMNPHRELWGISAWLPWAQVIIIATFVGCLVAKEPRRLPVNAITALFMALAVAFTLTTLVFGQGNWEGAFNKWDRAMKVILVLLLTAALVNTRDRLHAMIWIMAISLGFFGVKAGIFTIITGGGYRVWGPYESMISDNNHIGTAMLVAVPLMNYLRLQSSHRLVRIGLLAAMVLTVFAALGTQSRGAFLALVAAGGVMWLRTQNKAITGTAAVALIAGAIAFMPQSWVDRMNTIRDPMSEESAASRFVVWEVSWRIGLNSPLVGSGFRGPYTREVVDEVMPGGPARAVHSIWFEVIGEHGFPTFFLWLGLTVAGLWYTFRMTALARRHPEVEWLGQLGRMTQVSIAAYCVGGTFLSLAYWDYYWTLLVLLPAAYQLARRELPQGAEAAALGWRPPRPAVPAPAPQPEPVGAAARLAAAPALVARGGGA